MKQVKRVFGYDFQKIFVMGNLRAIKGDNCDRNFISWGYQFALYVQAKDTQDYIVGYVLDLSLFNRPVTIQQWILAQEKSCYNDCAAGKHDEYKLTPSYQYYPREELTIAIQILNAF